MLSQLVDNRYLLKAVQSLKLSKREKKKKTIPLGENLLGSIKPFSNPIQFNPTGSARKQGRVTIGVTSKRTEYIYLERDIWFLNAQSTTTVMSRRNT